MYDRIDKINDQYLIVDYKTGYANISDALNPNFTSPQLPLYALTQHSTPQIAYALMQSDPTLQQLDLTDAQAIEKRQKTRQYSLQDIDTLKQHWLSAATQIITDYQQGFFSASPQHLWSAKPVSCSLFAVNI